MSLLHTPTADKALIAPDFRLPDCNGKSWNLSQCCGESGTLIAFICNHCPYVQEIAQKLGDDCRALKKHGVSSAFVMSNDFDDYSQDAPDKMAEFARKHNFEFPYLVDETQEVAKAYGAVCTPDFFGFNAQNQLVWRGNAAELLPAMKEISKTNKAPATQTPSMGCSIKWRA